MSKWDELSMAEKAEMMKVAVRQGITNLSDIKQRYNEFAEGGSKVGEEEGITDEQYLNTMEKVAEENYKNWGYNNSDEALVHALNDNTYDYRGYYNKYPQSRANADTHWTDEFKTVYHPTFSNESIYSSKKSQYNPYGLPGGFWVGEDENASFIPMAWQAINNQYKSGGGIHIKPSHRGRLTELKKRTGKTEAELYRTGGPAVRKMITFARNSRKWKHGLGGNLFEDGGKPNIFRRPDGTYFYQADPDSEEIIVTPLMTSLGDESQWTYIDEVGKHYTPQRTITQGEVLQGEEPSILDNVFLASNTNYTNPILGAPARWKYSWTNGSNPVKALWDSPFVLTNPYLLGAKTISNLAGKEGIPKTIRLYQNSDGSDNAQWLWQRSLAGDLLESTMLFPAAAEIYQLGNKTIQGGRRLIQNVGDRYQGMVDASNFRANKNIRPNDSAADITNYIWLQRQGNIASDRAMLPAIDGSSGLRDASGAYYHQVTTKGGNQTINVHLGGTSTGDKPWELKAMEPSRVRWLNEYLETAPQGTIFGEVGSTKNYAEQYANVKPSWLKATKDAVLSKNEYNPYWGDYEESLIARIAGAGEDNEVIDFYSNLLNNNNPLSADSYKMMLDLARKGKYSLRYDSAPMGLFNSQGVRQRDFYNSLLELNPEDKVEAINTWINNINPKARPAYLKDGEVIIPRPLLLKNTPSKNTWLRKNK